MQQIDIQDWKKFHRFQEKSGWCGPAVIQMGLLSAGIKKTQREIAKDVYQGWWGTTPQIMLAYFSRFFKDVNYKNNSTIEDLSAHLAQGYIVIVNWWDDIDKDDIEGGHYSIVEDCKSGKLTLVDPSNARQGIWTIDFSEFKDKWFDYLDVNNKIRSESWMIWVDPASKI